MATSPSPDVVRTLDSTKHSGTVLDTQNMYQGSRYQFELLCACGWSGKFASLEDAQGAFAGHLLTRTGKLPKDYKVPELFKPPEPAAPPTPAPEPVNQELQAEVALETGQIPAPAQQTQQAHEPGPPAAPVAPKPSKSN